MRIIFAARVVLLTSTNNAQGAFAKCSLRVPFPRVSVFIDEALDEILLYSKSQAYYSRICTPLTSVF